MRKQESTVSQMVETIAFASVRKQESNASQEQQGGSKAGAGGGHWVYTHHKRPHSHDVRAMDVVRLGGGRAVLLSGGECCLYLCVCMCVCV